ncbi:unnamed protein product [Brachionus calyciflorus]|uniref:Uncharacterized protein n=1 Tax=Brachionus calyciflorus TaxID=104777 RepID=A0A814HIH8_9BILA|nr:unnamed protein product [Brachionus calyciflorus]
MDDEFGGFEAAPCSVEPKSHKNPSSHSKENLPEWILNQTKSLSVSPNPQSGDLIENLMEELARTKEQLLDQKTNYIQLQTKQRQEDSHNNDLLNQFQAIMNQALKQQRDIMTKEFRQAQHEQELSLIEKIREINIKFEQNLNEKFECKLAEFQETLIKHYESEFEDLELKIKFLIDKQLKEVNSKEKDKLKQDFDNLESNLRQHNEKIVQKSFQSQADLFKDQIRSTVLQEHLIHKDLISNKLEKLFRDSEEKRRKTNILFARHMSSLNFFVGNAQKQMDIIKDAYKDMLKNKEILDYYGDEKSGLNNFQTNATSNYSLSNLVGIIDPILNTSQDKSPSKDNLFEMPDDLNDEELLS